MSSLMKDNLPVVIAVSGGTALLATYLYQKNKDSAKYPPGPTSFPFVGNLFQLSTRRNCIPGLFNRWANKYALQCQINMVLTTTSKPAFLPWSLFDYLSYY